MSCRKNWHTTLKSTNAQLQWFELYIIMFCTAIPFLNISMQSNMKIYLNAVKSFWLTNVIAFATLGSGCNKVGTEARYTWSLENAQKKYQVGLSSKMLLANLLEHIFQTKSLETLHPKWNGRRVQCKEELHPAEKQPSLGIVELPTGRKSPEFYRNLPIWNFHY